MVEDGVRRDTESHLAGTLGESDRGRTRVEASLPAHALNRLEEY
jgi:hypothetical protein